MGFQAIKDKNPTSTLKRFAREIGPMQCVREIYMNSLEAGATHLRVYYEPQHLKRGIRKLCFADNGKGMTAQEMYEYLAKYNSSSKTDEGSYHDNFGIGVKATTLLANPYGVVFLSWSDDNPDGALAWFTYDEGSDRVGLKAIEYVDYDDDEPYDETLSTLMPDGISANIVSLKELQEKYPAEYEGIRWHWCKKAAKIEKHGTIIMLLGSSRDADSIGVDWTQKSLPHYMSSRFIKTDIKLIIDSKIGNSSASAPMMRGKGLLDVLHRYVKHTDVISHQGFEIDVHYVDVPYNKSDPKTAHYLSAKALSGYCALEYKGELYHVTYGKREARSWGISHEDVIKKVLLIVRPPHRGLQADGVIRGCYPNERRDRLLWDDESIATDNREIDLTEIKYYFATHQPERLRLMLEEAHNNTERESVDVSELSGKLKDLFKLKKSSLNDGVIQSKDGELTPDSSSSNRINPYWIPPELPGVLNPPKPKPKAGKKGKGKSHHAVCVNWKDDLNDFDRAGITMPFCVTYSADLTSIDAYVNFSTFVDLREHLMNLYAASSEVELLASIKEQIRVHYEIDLKMYALHHHAQSRRHPLFKTYQDVRLKEDALAMRLLGSPWLMLPKIEQALAQKGYKKKKA
jgi:hypothetical protein